MFTTAHKPTADSTETRSERRRRRASSPSFGTLPHTPWGVSWSSSSGPRAGRWSSRPPAAATRQQQPSEVRVLVQAA